MQDADALAKSIRDKMANQQVQPISKETGSD
jgi:hypothetical protein